MDKIITAMKVFAFFANRNSEVKRTLEDVSSTIFIDVKQGTSFYVKIDGGKIAVKSGTPQKIDGTIKTQKEALEKIISGKLSQEDAFNKKIVESTGSIRDIMRFRRVLNIALEKSFWVKLMRSTLGRFI